MMGLIYISKLKCQRIKFKVFLIISLSLLTCLSIDRQVGQALGADFTPRDIYQRSSPGVLLIIATKDGGGGSAGTGSIINKDGFVITNAHVIFDKSANKIFPKITVFFKPDRVTGDTKNDLSKRSPAKIITYSTQLDLALLKIEDLPKGAPIIELANPDEIGIGEQVVAIGHPEQGGLWTLTTGVISANISDFQGISGKDVFQTETSVNRGNSGGPLLDKRGYMVGINSNIARMGEGGIPITGVNFAIKSSVAKGWLANEGYQIGYGLLPLGVPGDEKARIQKEEPGINEKKEPAEKKVKPEDKVLGSTESKSKTQKPEKPKEEILTEKRPYDMDKLIKTVEEEMEDIMEEMRGKIREKRPR